MADQHLTALDATFLELEEADQSAHMHIGGVMILEAPPGEDPPGLDELRAGIEARLGELPRYRQRLSEPHTGGLSWPEWVDDERFDIAHHVRGAALPGDAAEAELLEWASEYFAVRLDRARPLWELIRLELGDGRWALVSKTHHCMVDGVGSVEIAHTLFDAEPVPSDVPGAGRGAPTAPSRSGGSPSAPASPSRLGAVTALPKAAAGAGAALVRLGFGIAKGTVHAGASAAGTAVHPGRASDALANGRALVEELIRDEFNAAPATSLNEPIGAARRLAVLEFDLEELKAIKRGLGGTVNDVVLAATAGGLRRLFEHRGEAAAAEGVRAMVPVNIRAAAEHLELGNRISSLFVHLPVDEADPRRRYARQLAEAERLKSGTQATGSRQIIELAAHAPPILHSFLARSLFATRLFNVTVTNVPGPQVPLYVGGSRLVAIWPLVPLAAEHALGLAVLSYDGKVFFCLNVARDSVPDLDEVTSGIEDSIAELTGFVSTGSRTGVPGDR